MRNRAPVVCLAVGVAALLAMAGCRTAATRGDSMMPTTLKPAPVGEFVRSWLVCGPFPCAAGDQDTARRAAFDSDLLASAGGEAGICPQAGQPAPGTARSQTWLACDSPADTLDLTKALADFTPHDNAVAYAYASLCSERAQSAWLAVGSDDAVKVFLNGECVLDRYLFRGAVKDQDMVQVKLVQGTNRILLKVLNGTGGWAAICRVLTADQALARLQDAAAAASLACECVFAGDRLPTFRLDLPDWAQCLAGRCTVQATFYDAGYNEVTTAARPGRYGAIVKVVPREGRPRTEFVTLFRRPGEVNWRATTWETFASPLPPGLGIAPDVARNQQASIGDCCKWLFADGLGKPGVGAVLLAGLYETSPTAPPAVRRTDVWSRDQNWWYGLKKKQGLVNTRYLTDLPPGYAAEPARRWPLVLFLHGAGERGDDLARVRLHGPPKRVAAGDAFPFILVSPQCPSGVWWCVPELLDLLDRIQTEYRVDPDRIYCTGLSMGGFGTWALACESPARFAAIAPICGGGDPREAERIAGIPSWVFHGGKDTVVPPAMGEEMVHALQAVGAKPGFTLYPAAGHDSWTATYNNPAFYEWLLANRRGHPVWPTPAATAP